MKLQKIYLFTSILALTLSGCASGLHKDDSKVVGEHAVERWNLLIQRKADKAYDFLAPGYRATISRDDYAKSMNNRPVAWKSVDLVDVTCDGDVCTTHVKLAYKVAINMHGQHEVSGNSPLEERWIRESGHWYVLPNDHASARNSTPKSP